MIRLLGTLVPLTMFVFVACSNGGGDCTDIGGSIIYGADAVPFVEGEVVTTASCLQIIDIKVGEGDAVQPEHRVSVHFTGYLENGTIFDTSHKREQPIAFALTRVMQGWQEGIPGMQVGGERRLIVPAELAAGSFGFGPAVPPDVTVIFDIELLEIVR